MTIFVLPEVVQNILVTVYGACQQDEDYKLKILQNCLNYLQFFSLQVPKEHNVCVVCTARGAKLNFLFLVTSR